MIPAHAEFRKTIVAIATLIYKRGSVMGCPWLGVMGQDCKEKKSGG